MRVMESKALARDHGLRNYSRMRKAELVPLLQNNSPPAPQTIPPRPTRPSPPSQSGDPTPTDVSLWGTLEGCYLGTYR